MPVKIAQTIQPQVIMLKAPELAWWEVSGVLPSIAAIVTVAITSVGLYKNTTRTIASNREDLEKTLEDSDKKAQEDRAHTANESKLEREDAVALAKEDRDAKLALARHQHLLEARSEIYAEVLRDFQKVQALIGGLPSTPLDQPEDPSDLAVMRASVNKLWIWGETESVYKVRELYSLANEFFYAALPKARIIKALKRAVMEMEKAIDGCIDEMKRLEGEKKAYEDFSPEEFMSADIQDKIRRIDRDYERQSKARGAFANHKYTRSVQIDKRSTAYLDFVIDRQSALMAHINSVMASARTDVGLEGASALLVQQSHEMSERVRRAVDKMKDEPEGDLP